jgi:V/A-type H+/Na+-transporting ATPase subunit I
MSIMRLVRVTILGLLDEKEEILSDLQGLGCLHIISRKPSGEIGAGTGISPDARRALAFLLSSPQRRTQARSSRGFDAEKIQAQALELEEKLHNHRDERDHLHDRIKNLQPWGDFKLPPLDEIKNLRLWFYLVPHHLMKNVGATDLNWARIHKDERFDYVVVISEDEPRGMPVNRTITGSKSLAELEQRLDEVESEIEDLEAERFSMTRWCDLFAGRLSRLEDKEDLKRVQSQTLDTHPLFMLEAWAPKGSVEALKNYSQVHDVALDIREPDPLETPPTLLQNHPELAAGQDLLTFYMTPNYWLTDPSIIIFFSFVLFFAMILADAGYALILGIFLLLMAKKMGNTAAGRRMRILFAAIVYASLIWGVMVGSYFGKEPGQGSMLAWLKLLDLNDYKTMMTIAILIGAFHVILANFMDLLRKGWKAAALAPLGWISIIVGALLLAACAGGGTAAGSGGNALPGNLGIWLMSIGGAAVLFFSGVGRPWRQRLAHGLERLTKVSNAFGDVMSYLRLFALGLASASLAIAFNDLARQVYQAIPHIGKFFAFFVLLVGHGLNLILGIMAGVVHGLRLNVIEFLNWSTPEEGYPFRAFARKEEV